MARWIGVGRSFVPAHDHTPLAATAEKVLQGIVRMTETVLVGLVLVALIAGDLNAVVIRLAFSNR